MSTREKESLLKSDYKSKLNRMGVSLDRTDHPLNYYKQLFYEKSNAKSKVTKKNTPFYKEKKKKKKRQRSSSKKTKGKKNLDFEDISEEKSDEESNEINNTKGIKTTRLIESKKKKMSNKKEEIKSEKKIKNKKNEILISEKKENISNTYNLRNKSGPKGNEKNIILFGAQSDINNNNYYNNKNKNNKRNISSKKSPQKDIYLKINEKAEEPKEKPILIEKKKRLLKRYPDVNEEETGPKLDQYHQVEDNNIITYDNNEINTQEENPIISETSSNYSNATSRFSRFSNYTLMSFSRLGNNIVNAKNCIMNKFKRNAYLFPLIILILFGIVFFWNERYENFERRNIIIIFSIIMGLIVLFHLCKCLNEIRKYKKMAKEDKKKLMELLEKNDIKKEDIGNNIILLKEFFEEVIGNRGLDYDVYMKNVFPYLVKYLKRDGYILEIQKDEENDGNNLNYWKRM